MSHFCPAGIAYEQKAASVPSSIDTNQDVNELWQRNVVHVAQSITWSNFHTNDHLSFLVEIVSSWHRYWLQPVAHQVLQPLVAFVNATERNIIFPKSSVTHQSAVANDAKQDVWFGLNYILALANLGWKKAVNVAIFPGNVSVPYTTVTESFTFTSKRKKFAYPTHTYLVPGDCLTLSVRNSVNDDSWTEYELIIGAYTDHLKGKTSLHRQPKLKYHYKIVEHDMAVCWPWGGLVTFRAPASEGKNLSVSNSQVIFSNQYQSQVFMFK